MQQPVAKVFGQAGLCEQLRDLGLRAGDVAVLRVGLRNLGQLAWPGDETLIKSLLKVLGPRGTLLAHTPSPTQWIFRRDRGYVFDPGTAPCTAGRFSTTLLQWPGACRSSHPTCSMAAVGARARDLLGDHDHRATCFAPFGKFIEANAWMACLGCAQTSPGYATCHYVYEELGLAHHSLFSGLVGCYHRAPAGVRWFTQRDVPGCSMGYHHFYPLYRRHGFLRIGPIGSGEAYAIRAADAYAVEKAAVAANPRISLCDNPQCLSCRGSKLFNLRDMPRYWMVHGSGRIWNQLARMFARDQQRNVCTPGPSPVSRAA
jgi:aminoglycoside N3'-acetyltransferase